MLFRSFSAFERELGSSGRAKRKTSSRELQREWRLYLFRSTFQSTSRRRTSLSSLAPQRLALSASVVVRPRIVRRRELWAAGRRRRRDGSSGWHSRGCRRATVGAGTAGIGRRDGLPGECEGRSWGRTFRAGILRPERNRLVWRLTGVDFGASYERGE